MGFNSAFKVLNTLVSPQSHSQTSSIPVLLRLSHPCALFYRKVKQSVVKTACLLFHIGVLGCSMSTVAKDPHNIASCWMLLEQGNPRRGISLFNCETTSGSLDVPGPCKTTSSNSVAACHCPLTPNPPPHWRFLEPSLCRFVTFSRMNKEVVAGVSFNAGNVLMLASVKKNAVQTT